MVGRPTHWPESGRQSLPKFWEWSVGPPKGLGVVGRPSRRPTVVGRSFQRYGNDWEALPKFRE